MTCADAILQALAGGPATPKQLDARLPFAYSVINRYLKVLKAQGRVKRLKQGLWGVTGQTYTPKPAGRPRRNDGVSECAAAFGITRQRASTLVRDGLAWKEEGEWVRKHTTAGRAHK